MPKSKATNVVEIGQRNLVDAQEIGKQIGFTSKWVNAMAAAGKIPWHGVRNGVKTYRRFDPDEVMAALAHGVEEAPNGKPRPVPVHRVQGEKIRSAKAG
jgi:hypothetical protein